MMRQIYACAVAVLFAAPAARAQLPETSPRPELRVDAIIADRRTSIQGGAGLQIPVGYYARIGIDGAIGADIGARATRNGPSEISGRVDAVARFLFDPFRQSRWALSAGGGVSLRTHEGDRIRPVLLAVLDLEGPRSTRGLSPAIQIGLGGGARVGVALRWADLRLR